MADRIASGTPLHEIGQPTRGYEPKAEVVFGCQPWRREWPADPDYDRRTEYRTTTRPAHLIAGLTPDDRVVGFEVCRICGDGYGDRDRLEPIGGVVLVCEGCRRQSGE